MKRKNNFYIYSLLGTIIFLLILFNFFTFPYSDDFSRLQGIVQKGPLKFQLWKYNTWDGRELGLPAIIRAYATYIFRDVRLVNLIWTLFLIAIGFSIPYIFKKFLIFNKKDLLILGIISSGLIWIIFYPILYQVVYWLTGGTYTLKVLVFLLFIIIIENNKINNIWLVIVSFILGTTGIQYLLVTFTYLFFLIIKDIIENSFNRKFFKYLHATVFFILGQLFVNLAPGNKIRVTQTGAGIEDSLISIIEKYFLQIDRYIFYFKSYILIGIILLSILLALYSKKHKIKKIDLFYSLRWLALAIVFPISFSLFKELYQPIRVAQIFELSLVFFFTEIILFLTIKLKKSLLIKYREQIQFVISLFIVIIIGATLSKQITFYYTQYKPRNDYLNSLRYHTAIVCPFNLAGAPFNFVEDISPSPDYWRNKNLARYYHLKKVKQAKIKLCGEIINKSKKNYEESEIYNWIWLHLEVLRGTYGDIRLKLLNYKQ